MSKTRFVFDFDQPASGGRELLGGKGIGLAEMTALGLPVPGGFTITTEACRSYMQTGTLPAGLEEELAEHLRTLEARTGKRLGDRDDPLLVSVRSGAAISMPGMMDTILNLGLNDEAVVGLATHTANPRFAYDSYRRLIQMFGEVVDGIDPALFETALGDLKRRRGVTSDTDLGADDLRELVASYHGIYRRHEAGGFPASAHTQLMRAVSAVFDSWDTPRARVYRQANGIPDTMGTAVNIVQMVFGNKGERSGTGVVFTRNPATGADERFGEFLANAQGEDVVAGIRTPQPIAAMATALPEAYRRLETALSTLEAHYRDMQDVEFTVEDGTLYLLQTRSAKRTAAAALRAAVDMVAEGMLSRTEAIVRIDPGQLDQLLHPRIDPSLAPPAAAKGLNASPGAASGGIVFDADAAVERSKAGPVILVREDTTPDDIHGMIAAQGILTVHGGMTSHAAVVARGMGKPCVAGCEGLELGDGTVTLGGLTLREGDLITIDGGTGEVFVGDVALVAPSLDAAFETLLGWADEHRRLGVRANGDTPLDAAHAREFGAEGIGLCRTEHMFFGQERLPLIQQMIVAEDAEGRRAALEALLPFQQSDFEGIFEAMEGLPVTIRLLDPPLHEFLPSEELATDERIRARIRTLHEVNPMLGMRGCRLGIVYPEIYEMQVRAIARAALAVRERLGVAPEVEIMHPLIGFVQELSILRELTERIWLEEAPDLSCPIGTMIELPRACVRAEEIAAVADFFSFGTNDLTQTALGISRDDADRTFLARYLQEHVLERSPFEVLDIDGVGELMRIAIAAGRRGNPQLKLGICGEHGGEPRSVAFCHEIGLDYVSCSPFRVPIARLAAAQAALAAEGAPQYAAAGG